MKTDIMKRNAAQPATVGSFVDQVFRNSLNRFFEDEFWGFNHRNVGGQVPVNIRETDTTYEMELVAPGMQKQDFKIGIAGNQLTISAAHEEQNRQEDETGIVRREFTRQAFSRSFTIDDTIDTAHITARYEHGLLYLTLPKKENAQKLSRTIEIG
jgi:HSP20 family protein